MSLAELEFSIPATNPLDIVEAMFSANDWPFERTEGNEIYMETTGGWCDYELVFAWREEMQSLYFACKYEAKIPAAKQKGLSELLMLANQKVWMGHFSLATDEAKILFRHTIPVRGLSQVSIEVLEDLIDVALAECERFFPAFQLLVWGNYSPEQAVNAALLDCAGVA